MKRRLLVLAAVILCAVLLVTVFSREILWAMGAVLVNAQTPEKADVVLVLAGDNAGRRVGEGVQLVKDGYAPKLLISGPFQVYGVQDSVLAARYAEKLGLRSDQVIPILRDYLSTSDEARAIVPLLRQMGIHKYLLVTGPSHTARAGRVFRRVGPDLQVRTVAAPDPKWCRGYWWTQRECQKTWLMEATKNVADFFRI
jgi:uncharacterized SAM-binding protein YcdF (DUF218 family)